MIHQYILNGYYIVTDANSASVHTVDETAYDMIRLADSCVHDGTASEELKSAEVREQLSSGLRQIHDISTEECFELLDELAELAGEGLIWSADPYEEAAGELKIRQSVLKAICLHVAHGCNMDCEYCFAGKATTQARAGS